MYRYSTFVINKTDEAEPSCPPQLNTVEGEHRTSDSQMEVKPRNGQVKTTCMGPKY
jgi:hypothetical protein